MKSKLNVKQKEQIIIVVTVTALILMFIGISYAYFTSVNNERSGSSIVAVGGKMLINYDDGTDDIKPVTNIKPSNAILVDKTFTLTGTNTTKDLTMPYKVGLKYTSTFSDGMMHYYIKEVNRPANSNVTANYVIKPETGKTENDYKNQTVPGNMDKTGYVHGTLKKGNMYTEMVIGEFPASTDDQNITFNLILQFPDNNENQDSEKGATINGKVVVNYDNSIATYLAKLDKTKNGLEEDKTTDKNLRYVGASPRNYLKFNGETWRIIGVFNNITTIDENGKEKKESLVKIVRNDSLGNYSWDSSGSDKNSGYGINEWSQADLMTELNTDYINQNPPSETPLWHNGQNNAKNGSYDYNNNLKNNSSIDKVAKVRWNLGGYNTSSVSALNMYNYERGTLHVSNPSDGITRKDYWDGKIALIYPSDYGYASTDTTCRGNLGSTDSNNNVYCKNENWLFNSATQWTLFPRFGDASSVFYVYSDGSVYYSVAGFPYGVRPALFLKSDVVIAGGTGESVENAYTLE